MSFKKKEHINNESEDHNDKEDKEIDILLREDRKQIKLNQEIINKVKNNNGREYHGN